MSRIVVVGAGVVGQVYAGLLAKAHHDVTLVARGARAAHLHDNGVVLDRDDVRLNPACRIVGNVADAGDAETLIVAVRGDQLASVKQDVAASAATTVVCMTNPLEHREAFEQRVGAERTVFAFSGVGGFIDDGGVVRFHIVRQQPTVVDVYAPHGSKVAELFAGAGLPIRRESRMPDWSATHTVFIAGIGSALLAGGGADGVARSRGQARELVKAVSEAFDELSRRGSMIRPASLRTIFGRVPTWIAARYWQHQFASPMVRVSIEPHVQASRDSEFPQVVDFALRLVGDRPQRYRRLLESGTSHRDEA